VALLDFPVCFGIRCDTTLLDYTSEAAALEGRDMKFPSSSSPPVALAALLALCSVCYLGSASGQAVYGGGSEAWSGWSTVVS